MALCKSIRLVYPRTAGLGSFGIVKGYATDNSTRRQVTIANDDGRVQWSQLSTKEKAARTTQQTFNFGVVVLGAIMTIGVSYLLYDTVFSPESKTSHFNRAFEDIKASSEARELLGPAKQLRAYGEPSWNKWTRNRPIASTVTRDASGKEHMSLRFYVEGPDGKGTVHITMIRRNSGSAFEYETFMLTVPGHPSVYLRNTDPSKPKSGSVRFLGMQWK